MENYLSKFFEHPAFKRIAPLLPQRVCPFLFYNLTPYIFTLAHAGWFSWTKKLNDLNYRKKSVEADFTKKDVNRLYPNEVLVRCPNPYASVVAGVGLWPENKIAVRILHRKGSCFKNHDLGNTIFLDIEPYKKASLQFHEVFPQVLMQSLGGRQLYEKSICPCDIPVSISVEKILYPCRYHKKEGEHFESLLPEGFCPHVFWLIYPKVLAIMYGARVEKRLTVQHPGQDRQLILNVEKVSYHNNNLVRMTIKALQSCFEAIFYPVDLLDYDLYVTVVKNESQGCSLEEGIRYSINIKNRNFLCPASFHALYPYMMLSTAGSHVEWAAETAESYVPCPDCIGSVYTVNN